MRKSIALAAVGSCFAAGCASTPDVVATHYLPKGGVTLRAVRTVGCATNQSGAKQLFVATSVVSSSGYSRDLAARDTVELKSLDGSLSNSNTTLTFYDDGRLKGVNSTSTGVGQEVVQSLVKLASIVLGGGIFAMVQGQRDVCDLITEQQPKEKMLSITYALSEGFNPKTFTDGVIVNGKLEPETSTATYLYEVAKLLPPVCASIGPLARTEPAALLRGTAEPERGQDIQDEVAHLTMRQPANVPLKVVERVDGSADELRRVPIQETIAECGTQWTELMRGSVQIPQVGTRYQLAIPRAAAFGGTAFELAVAESGAVTSVKYGKTSGAPALLGALTAAATEAQPTTTAQKALDAKAEADLIAQQQRLIRCQMDPSKCT